MRNFFVYISLFIQTFLRRHLKQIILASIAGFFITLFFLQLYPLFADLANRKHEKIGVIGSFSPSNLPLNIQRKISMGLTAILPNGEATAAASLSWKIEKGLLYTFKLDPKLNWHDDKQLTAGDINYRFKGAEFKVIDDHTLQVKLKEIYSPLPIILSQPIFRPHLIGLGPYKIVRLIQSKDSNRLEEITLYPLDKGLSTITYKFYPSTNDAILAFKLGEITKLEDMSDNIDIADWNNIHVIEKTDYDRLVGLFYNLNTPFFKEKEVRQALAYAIPPIKGVERAVSPISPLSWGYSNKIRLYNYDEESALKILSKSPLSSPSSELILSTYATLLPYAEKIVQAWKKVGINVKIKVENRIPSDYQVLMQTLPIPPDPDQYQYWQSTQENTNITNYSNPKIDKLLEDGRKTIGIKERKKIYADFQLYLIDDAPAIFLYYPKTLTIERK